MNPLTEQLRYISEAEERAERLRELRIIRWMDPDNPPSSYEEQMGWM